MFYYKFKRPQAEKYPEGNRLYRDKSFRIQIPTLHSGFRISLEKVLTCLPQPSLLPFTRSKYVQFTIHPRVRCDAPITTPASQARVLINLNETLRPPLPHFNDGDNRTFCL